MVSGARTAIRIKIVFFIPQEFPYCSSNYGIYRKNLNLSLLAFAARCNPAGRGGRGKGWSLRLRGGHLGAMSLSRPEVRASPAS